MLPEQVVRLESKKPDLDGSGEVTIRDLVRNALRRAGIQEREVADYLAELLTEYARQERQLAAVGGDGRPLEYFYEMVSALDQADAESGLWPLAIARF